MRRDLRRLFILSLVSWGGFWMSVNAVAEDKPAGAAQAPQPVAAVSPSDLSGHWSGTWLSDSNGHDGPLEGDFVKIDDDHYCVHFRGQFWGLIPFSYRVVLTVTGREGDKVTMAGSSNLGFLLGTFWYQATVTDTEFCASYCSKRDHGVFSMTRCQCCCE